MSRPRALREHLRGRERYTRLDLRSLSMSDLDELVPSSGEQGARRGLPFAWEGLVLLVVGAAIAIGGSVWGMWSSYERIERDPVPTPDELAVGVEFSQW